MELARKKPRFGYRRLQILLEASGTRVNHNRTFRVYREAGLAVRRKARKRLVRGLAASGAHGGEPGVGGGFLRTMRRPDERFGC